VSVEYQPAVERNVAEALRFYDSLQERSVSFLKGIHRQDGLHYRLQMQDSLRSECWRGGVQRRDGTERLRSAARSETSRSQASDGSATRMAF